MNKKSRILILIFTAIFAIAVSSSLFFSGYEVDHVCVGTDCQVCAVLDACRDFLNKVVETCKAVTTAGVACFAPIVCIVAVGVILGKRTPVTLKDKLAD